MKTCALPWSCSTWRPSAPGLRKGISPLEMPAADPEEKKPKAKDVKRKGAAVLAAEPDTKRGRDQPEPSKGNQYYVYHNLHTHNTNECQEPCVKEGSAVAPTAVTEAMVEEEEET